MPYHLATPHNENLLHFSGKKYPPFFPRCQGRPPPGSEGLRRPTKAFGALSEIKPALLERFSRHFVLVTLYTPKAFVVSYSYELTIKNDIPACIFYSMCEVSIEKTFRLLKCRSPVKSMKDALCIKDLLKTSDNPAPFFHTVVFDDLPFIPCKESRTSDLVPVFLF